jgi:hypothetical protein
VVEYWSKIHDEELHNFYSFPNIVKVLKSRGQCDLACIRKISGLKIREYCRRDPSC